MWTKSAGSKRGGVNTQHSCCRIHRFSHSIVHKIVCTYTACGLSTVLSAEEEEGLFQYQNVDIVMSSLKCLLLADQVNLAKSWHKEAAVLLIQLASFMYRSSYTCPRRPTILCVKYVLNEGSHESGRLLSLVTLIRTIIQNALFLFFTFALSHPPPPRNPFALFFGP
jgi:hypothetical protein